MSTETNAIVRAAQRLIRQQAKRLPQREQGYNQWGEDPKAKGYREAADLLDALIDPEEKK